MELTTDAILNKLKDDGLKYTSKRKAMVDLFVRHQDKYLSAKEVYEHIQEKFPSVSFDTIYRTLTMLLEHGAIEHLEFGDDAAKFRLKCSDEHHHHLVCLQCGKTFPLDECPMDLLSGRINNFKVLKHRFEVYGYCEQCLSA